jgi:hypothetical protein
MDDLTKTQKDEFATAFAILALYDGGVSAFSVGVGIGYRTSWISVFC